MKLIITIPKDKYCYIQELEQGNTDYATTRMLYHAVKHGKPYLEQEPFINKPCVSSGVCEHDKQKVLDKIRAEIIKFEGDCRLSDDEYPPCKQCTDNVFKTIYRFLDKYKADRSEE